MKYLIILITSILIIFITYNQYFNKIKVEGIQELVKNKTWETGLGSEISYKKGDNIELSYIVKNDNNNEKTIKLDTQNIIKKIDIEKIKINNKEINIDDNIVIDKDSIITIEGIAKENKSEENINEIKIIDEKKIEKTIPETIVPSNIRLNRNNINSNINNLLELSGKNLESIISIKIDNKNYIGKLNDKKDKYFVNLEKELLTKGKYNIFLVLNDNSEILLDEKLNIIFDENKVNIANITPNQIKNYDDTYIVLQGNGFSKIISIQLNNNIIIKNTSFKVINDNVASIKIEKGLTPGEYFFNIMHTSGIYQLSNNKFQINN